VKGKESVFSRGEYDNNNDDDEQEEESKKKFRFVRANTQKYRRAFFFKFSRGVLRGVCACR